jgi:hydroxymethylglutaryl-CoA reductase
MGLPVLIEGFSKLSRDDQVRLVAAFTHEPPDVENELNRHLMADRERQKIYTGFSENNISNFYLPYSIAPNFLINDRYYLVPMVTEESSVVAAASAAAKFWAEHGGFHTRIQSMRKPGHIHFIWKGDHVVINTFIEAIMPEFWDVTSSLTNNMRNRGGGILEINLKNLSHRLEGYYQLEVLFNTVDSMGANFINSCLERITECIKTKALDLGLSDRLEIIMSILSNYAPQCTVECSLNCHPDELAHPQYGLKGYDFAGKFELAANMARLDIYRAVTHNKGIFNGIDAVLISTGNDFRAVEAAGHAYASRDGCYRSLTIVELLPGSFTYRMEIPMTIGTTGGLTDLHPLVDISLKILGNPDAGELMSVASAAGLANNFSAIRALITTGIQHGHMRMHLSNLLNQQNATEEEKVMAIGFFNNQPVSHAAVEDFLRKLRTPS